MSWLPAYTDTPEGRAAKALGLLAPRTTREARQQREAINIFMARQEQKVVVGKDVVAIKVCKGCGQQVDQSMEVGKLYWCDWAYRPVGIRIKRMPLWKQGEKC